MTFIKIAAPQELNDFFQSVDWDHSFFREIYALTPSFVGLSREIGYVNPDSPANIAVLIVTFDLTKPAIELKIEGVKRMDLGYMVIIDPKAQAYQGGIEIKFNELGSIIAREVSYRVLPAIARSDRVRYGNYWDWLFES